MIGPCRQRWSLPSRQNEQLPHGSFARAATRSPGQTRVTPSPTSITRAQKLMAKKLHRRFGFQPALDLLVSECRYAKAS